MWGERDLPSIRNIKPWRRSLSVPCLLDMLLGRGWVLTAWQQDVLRVTDWRASRSPGATTQTHNTLGINFRSPQMGSTGQLLA